MVITINVTYEYIQCWCFWVNKIIMDNNNNCKKSIKYIFKSILLIVYDALRC